MKIMDMGFAYVGNFMVIYAIKIAGIAIINITPTYTGTVEIVLIATATIPKDNAIDKITKVVALAFVDVDTPPSKIPADKKIKPKNIVSPVSACIPSTKVCAISEYEMKTPATPMAVRPIPGIIRSQLLI
jgi:hypothetical protein